MAIAHPERVSAIISQNGNAYEEGLGDAWAPIRQYWHDPSSAHREVVRQALSPEGLRSQYTEGVPNPERIKPEGYTLDAAMIARPGNTDIQLDLFLDYASNVEALSGLPAVFSEIEAAAVSYLGQARSVLCSRRSRGISPR